MDAVPGERLERTGLREVFRDDLTGPAPDPARWVAHYMPHWSTPERSAARWAPGDGRGDGPRDGLRLLVEADQPAWRPEDGGLRVSSLQTGVTCGPAGSTTGQHRHRPDLRVRTPVPRRALWTPSRGVVEAVLSAPADPAGMSALWLVGLEDEPGESGELCVAELFGSAAGERASAVRSGVKAHHDPHLRDDVADVPVPFDTREPHAYAVEWDGRRTRCYADGALLRTVEQSPAYPLVLVVSLFEFAGTGERDPARYPLSARVGPVRGWERTGATA
ncbi:glycoside hydrolase family 16 protein [Kineococcus gypseus]|uniref:glycoside hydrolase family 16 protein n=1 Tax=Kineococcus gypseus TaxID=1637102 RepID=UPI003D7E8837